MIYAKVNIIFSYQFNTSTQFIYIISHELLINNSFIIDNNLVICIMEGQPQQCSFAGDYQIHALLGDGGQANVYLGSKENRLYAVKVYFAGQSKMEAYQRQAQFLSKLKYDHLINLVDHKPDAIVKIQGQNQSKRPILVLQYAEGAELFEHVKQGGRFSPEICRSLFKMLIKAINYLNSQGIAHRDLKLENILFDGNFNLKVSDFGLSTFSQGSNGDGILYSRVGTQGYKAPELEIGKYEGLQVDLFAAGVILFLMYTGTPPFISTKQNDRIYKCIREKNFKKFWDLHEKKKAPGFYPQALKDLLNSFLSADPSLRPTFDSLKQDGWLNGDEAMQEDIKKQLQNRYKNMAQNDEIKKKVQQVKEKFKKQIMEQQKVQPHHRGASQFTKSYQDNIGIKIQNLNSSFKKINFVKQSPAFVIAWIQNFLSEHFGEGEGKKCLIDCSFGDCNGQEFNLQIVDDKNIQLTMTFGFEDIESQEWKLSGQLVKSGDKVGIDWKKGEGNEFYLNQIVSQINDQLALIA